MEIAVEESDDGSEEQFDFNSPEDVLIEIVGPHDDNPENKEWKNWSIEGCTVIKSKDGITGAAQYEMWYSGYLDYAIMDMVECPGSGFYVVVGVTGIYTRGDGWMADDDFELYFEEFRPATEEEIKLY